MTASALEVRGVSRHFGAVKALQDVSFSVAPGEVVALVGDNGAGKSTLVKLISGTVRPSTGAIIVDGEQQSFAGPHDAQRAGIQTVFQTLSLIPTLDIAENVYLQRELFFGDPVRRRLRVMDRGRMRRTIEERLEELGLPLPASRTKVAALSGGQKQAVAIARAVLWGSHIVVLDEPTAALGVRQTEIVLSFIERLRANGVAVLFISHNMDDVLRVCDKAVVLRLGRKVAELPRAEASHQLLVSHMTGTVEATNALQ